MESYPYRPDLPGPGPINKIDFSNPALAPLVRAVLDTGSLCAIGNDEKIEEKKAMFGQVKNLFR